MTANRLILRFLPSARKTYYASSGANSMRRKFKRWLPDVGEKLTGRILYFENPDGTFIAVIRTDNGYFLLPPEAAHLFVAGRPPDGSLITIEKHTEGFSLRLGSDTSEPSESSEPSAIIPQSPQEVPST